MNARRKLLKASVLIGGAALVGGGFYYREHVNDRNLAILLASFLDYDDLAKSTGKRILNGNTSLKDDSFDLLINDLLTSMGTSRNKVSKLTQASLLQSLHERVTQDFTEEHVVIIDGWILSKTEAGLCVLAYQLS